MARFKPYVLPAAIVLGLLLHSVAPAVVWLVPCLVFTILLLNFAAVDLRQIRPTRIDCAVMAFQTVASLALYLLVRAFGGSDILAQGVLMCVLCPVASSVVVVTAALGVDRRITTGYTIYGNLLVTVLAPLVFTHIGSRPELGFAASALIIFRRIASVIALPFFLALVMQMALPRLRRRVMALKEMALPLWALALLITLGQTIDYIFLYHQGHEHTILLLGIAAVALCAAQFALGRHLGHLWGQPVAVGQLVGQKNTGIGIWMTFTFLQPLAAVALAFYAIAQNIFNSIQMWQYARKQSFLEH